MNEYQLFLAFKRGEYINETDLPKITNYYWGHLISWSLYRSYFECQYKYIAKLKVVCRWKKDEDYLDLLRNEKQYLMKNLLTFLRTNNIKNVFAR